VQHARDRKIGVGSIVLGVLGELMITAGLLIGGYILWNVWWDSNQSAAVAEKSVADFQGELEPAPRQAAEIKTEGDPPPVTQAITGDTFGILIVPKWYGITNNAMPLKEGTTPAVLDQAAAGHYENTAMPGEIGNFSVAGHRRSHGNSFRRIDLLEKGDQVIVETKDTWYIYEVTGHEIVLPNQVEVIAPVPGKPNEQPTERMMTMTTCHSVTMGEWGNDHRWVTHSKLVGWMDRADGMPEQVLNDPEVK
jgi:sortase A